MLIGVKGEFRASGYLLQNSYCKDPGKTAEVMIYDKNGQVPYMHTEDGASFDD